MTSGLSVTPEQERFTFVHACVASFRSARMIRTDLDAAESLPASIFNAAYRAALIDYAKPFKRSNGFDGRSNRLPLPDGLSQEQLALHDRIIAIRDQVFAHDDLPAQGAAVHVSQTVDSTSAVILYVVPEFIQTPDLIELTDVMIGRLLSNLLLPIRCDNPRIDRLTQIKSRLGGSLQRSG